MAEHTDAPLPASHAVSGHGTDASGLTLEVDKRLGDFLLKASLTVPARGVTALFGASGSGKTSLLRLIAGLDTPDKGVIRIGEHSLVDTRQGVFVPPHRRRLGVVFQEARLFPHYRVRGNLTYGMRPGARSRFDDIVDLLGISPLLNRFPATLSGGEARRVAIGRALLTEPRLLLMDEPLTGLDGARKQELLRYIARLARDIDIPIVYVSHDPDELIAIADHLVLLDQGRVLAHGRLDELLTRFDLTEYLGGFDAASVITATVADHDHHYALTQLRLEDGQRLTIPLVDDPPGTTLRLRIPIRDVALALSKPEQVSYRNQLSARVEQIGLVAGNKTSIEVRLRVGEQILRARLTRKSFDELGVKEGISIVALIRSVAFDTR
ncbi:molybdate transport system ATP-binding protein [Modicisalibacter ilicicola DSM 19980]|uniref:Molybdate transport system ATP-binding protein n=1 Tax=Modicisalibacter ilicicola DSM 19980 TaxID=1121942 RepID=A0A1M5A1M5_9GAMM|nr:molybdenum ABC transporter ATP-binding protein [Halomonas ilicicola]SHF24124.1 molybdate transport system ATP-binding protein [Halomonas ilicicola DSM 19980]